MVKDHKLIKIKSLQFSGAEMSRGQIINYRFLRFWETVIKSTSYNTD